MKNLVPFFSFALLVALVAFACSPKPKAPTLSEIKINEPFELGATQSAMYQAGQVKVTFTGITEDSRCPEGVECMWAGQVVANVIVASQGGSERLVFTKEGKSNKSPTQTFQDYKFRLMEVSPYPQNGVTIEKKDYRIKLVMSN